MKYVKTNRAKLNPAIYPIEVLSMHRDRDFYTNFPAPVNFTIPQNTKQITATELQLLAIWYCRGTQITFRNKTIQTKHPIDQWNYTLVDNFPEHYRLMGKTTTQLAYEYGQNLIARCTKASKIPFGTLEQSYKRIMTAFWRQLIIYSPNEKTYLEVRAEQQAFKEIRDLAFASNEAYIASTKFEEEELLKYASIFGIELPDWALKQTVVKTDHHGYAMLPQVEMNSNYTVPKIEKTSDGTVKHGYAGNDERDFIPTTLMKDAKPVVLNHPAKKAQLAEQVNWYLNTFNSIHDKTLLSDGWEHCTTCGFYKTNEGCECGLNPSIEEKELEEIRESFKDVMAYVLCYQDALGNLIR